MDLNPHTNQSYLAAATSDGADSVFHRHNADVGVSATEAPMRFNKCFYAEHYLNIWRRTITF